MPSEKRMKSGLAKSAARGSRSSSRNGRRINRQVSRTVALKNGEKTAPLALGRVSCYCFRLVDNGHMLDGFAHFCTEAAPPHVTSQQNLECGRQRHGQDGPDQSAYQQAPDEVRHDYRHRMQPNAVADDPTG